MRRVKQEREASTYTSQASLQSACRRFRRPGHGVIFARASREDVISVAHEQPLASEPLFHRDRDTRSGEAPYPFGRCCLIPEDLAELCKGSKLEGCWGHMRRGEHTEAPGSRQPMDGLMLRP
jgi:hypothetical protein